MSRHRNLALLVQGGRCRRSVWLSMLLFVEGRTHAEVAAQYGLSRSWVTRLVARYRLEGDTAFEARSRRPRTSPTVIPAEVVELAVNLRSELSAQGLDAGPHTVCWHLQQRHQITVSPSTVRRRFVDLGLVEPNPKKRPRSSYVRFQADLPNEMWQSDFTHWPLADGSTTEIITWLDDCSRYALSVTVHWRITGPIVVDTFDQTCVDHGVAASTLTDNAMVYTTRFSAGKAAETLSRPASPRWASPKRTLHPTTPPPAGKSNVSNKPSRNGSPPNPAPTASTNSKASSTNSSTPTTTTAPTDPSDVQPPPPSTTGCPKQPPNTTAPTSTSESATTASTKQAPSPSATTADYTTSASAELTNTPPYPCWSPTSTSESSQPKPVNSYDTSPLTRPATTNPKTNPENPAPAQVHKVPMS